MFTNSYRVFPAAGHSLRYTQYFFRFCSKTVVGNTPVLSKESEAKNSSLDKKDSFQIPIENRLVHITNLIESLFSLPANLSKKPLSKLENETTAVDESENRIKFLVSNFIQNPNQETLDQLISLVLPKNLHILCTEQLVQLLNQLCLNAKPSEQFEIFVKELDKACSLLSVNWDRTVHFAVAQNFSSLNVLCMRHLQEQIMKVLTGISICEMTHEELVIYLSCVLITQRFPSNRKRALEERIIELLDTFTITEVGAICSAFFGCKQKIASVKLIEKLVEKLLVNAHDPDERAIGSILKVFRLSTCNVESTTKSVLNLQAKLNGFIDKWGPKVLIQLVAVGANVSYFHIPTIERVVQKFLTNLEETRLKDMERLAMTIAISCHVSPTTECFWKSVKLECIKDERRQEFFNYPNSFISLVNYAIMANHFFDELLEIVLSPDFVRRAKEVALASPYISIKRELLQISCSVKLEKPDYDGPNLCQEDVKTFEKIYKKPMPKEKSEVFLDVFLLELLSTARQVLGSSESANLVYFQPHFAIPDILCTLDEVQLKNRFWGNTGTLSHIVLIGGSRNMFSKYFDQPMGPLRMKIRQFKSLGYAAIPVPWFEFRNRTINERQALIKHKMLIAMKDNTKRNL